MGLNRASEAFKRKEIKDQYLLERSPTKEEINQGWAEEYDIESDKTFYHNRYTDEISWTLPDSLRSSNSVTLSPVRPKPKTPKSKLGTINRLQQTQQMQNSIITPKK